MKKILAISLIAMTAVSAANAQIASKAYVDQREAAAVSTAEGYTDQKIGTYTGDAAGSATVAEAISAAVSGIGISGYVPTTRKVNNEPLSADVTLDGSEVKTATGYTKASAVASIVAGTDSVDTALGKLEYKIDAVDYSGKQDTSNMITATTGYNASATDKYPSMATAAAIADAAAASAVSGAASNYATAAQGLLADSAVQSVAEGSTNGTVAVDGTDVAVHGLGTAAYTASTAYASAAQGTKADSAIQTVTKTGTGNLLTGVSTSGDTVTITVSGTALVDPATSNENGVYVLTATTSDGTATYAWEQITRATPAQQGGGD